MCRSWKDTRLQFQVGALKCSFVCAEVLLFEVVFLVEELKRLLLFLVMKGCELSAGVQLMKAVELSISRKRWKQNKFQLILEVHSLDSWSVAGMKAVEWCVVDRWGGGAVDSVSTGELKVHELNAEELSAAEWLKKKKSHNTTSWSC